MAVYWGIQGTSPNENVSKLETDRQTKAVEKKTDRHRQKREKKSKRAIKKKTRELLVSETMTFLPIESDA